MKRFSDLISANDTLTVKSHLLRVGRAKLWDWMMGREKFSSSVCTLLLFEARLENHLGHSINLLSSVLCCN